MLWSSEFTRPAAQAAALQAQVATEVAGVLRCTVDAGNFGGRIPPESLSLYLRACDVVGTEGPDKVRDLFQQVVAREPGFANAWADLAMVTALGAGDMPPDMAAAARRDARAAADRALRLDPKASMAYAAFNLILSPSHFEERQGLLSKGLSISPNNVLLNQMEGDLLGEVGRSNEAITYYRRAALLDPLHPDFTINLAGALASVGSLTEARSLAEQVARLWPDVTEVPETRLTMEARWGDPDRALALLDDPKSRPADWEAPMIEKWRRFSLVRRDHDSAKTAAFARDVLANLATGRTDLNRAIRDLVGVGATEAAFDVALRSTPADPLDTEVLFRTQADGMWRPPASCPSPLSWALSNSGSARTTGRTSAMRRTGPMTAAPRRLGASPAQGPNGLDCGAGWAPILPLGEFTWMSMWAARRSGPPPWAHSFSPGYRICAPLRSGQRQWRWHRSPQPRKSYRRPRNPSQRSAKSS